MPRCSAPRETLRDGVGQELDYEGNVMLRFLECPITSWNIEGGKSRNSDRFYFLGFQNHCGQ